MTTATGDVVYNFAATANVNPWPLADGTTFAVPNGMTAIISSFALKSNFNSNGFLTYLDNSIDQDSFEVKGETVKSSSAYGDQVGCGAVNPSGNGYILWMNGPQWRLYKSTAFVLTQLTDIYTSAHAAFDVMSLDYAYAVGTATLTAKLNGVATSLLWADSASPYHGDLAPCWFFNFDDSNGGGFRSIAIDGLSAAGVTIDSTPTDIRIAESRTIRVTAPTTAMTTGNTTVKINSSGNSAITPSAVTNISGLTYDVVFTVTDEYAGLPYSAAGYGIIVTTTDGSVTSANVPFLPNTGNDYVTLTDVSATDIESSPALEVLDQVEWTNAAVIDIDSEGKVTSSEASATFEFRVWDHDDSTWGDWSEATWGSGGSESNQNGVIVLGIINDGVIL